MSRMTVRILLIAAIGFVIIAGTFATVQALSAVSVRESKGMYVLGGSLAHPFKEQAADETLKPKLDTYRDPSDGGHDCESKSDSSDL